MDILFSHTASSDSDALVKDSNFKEFAPSTHINMAWSSLLPFIKPATLEYLLPYLGRPMYDVLVNAYQSTGTVSSEISEALELAQYTIANYVRYDFLPQMNVRETDSGPQQTSDQEGTSSVPNQWSYKEKRWDTLKKADKYLDLLLQYLHEQVAAGNIEFNAYKNSTQYQQEGSSFFRSVEEMEQYLNIQGCRRAFTSISRYFLKAERRYLAPAIGEEFYNELQSQYRANTLTTENEKAVKFVQHMMAEWGIYEAIPHISSVLQGDAIVIVSRTDGFDRKQNNNTVFGQSMIERVQQRAEQNGGITRRELLEFLITNKDDYPTYRDSSSFPTDPEPGSVMESEGGGAVFL